MELRLVILLLFVGFSPFMLTAQKVPTFKVVGYYSLDAARKNVKPKTLKRLTHINLWFLNPDSLGNFTRDLSYLGPFVASAHDRNVKVLFSIGGGTKQPEYHHLLQDSLRPMLIKNLVTEVLRYDIDGVDVDLEGSNIDANYEKFVVELATVLRSYQKLTTAAIAVYYKDQLTDKALSQFDFVNVMSYDRTGPWRPENPGPHALYEHAVEDLDYFGVQRNIPKERMTLGVPFYGYGYGPELTSPAISMGFGKIVSEFRGAEMTDQWTMPGGKILYYNGVPTIERKTRLAAEKASGIMIWEIRSDARGSKSLLKAIHRVAKEMAARD
ncbi:MAG TPA: glycosyl hydrolase family 18 protein [Ohtaekwangia sp.]|nr:glycosyl hydrolase family 18 protein [Ohtaekwangia sp.]